MKIWIHRLIGIVIAAIVLLFVFFFVNAAGYGASGIGVRAL